MTDLERELLNVLRGFMDMWNSGDATAETVAAQRRRAALWAKAGVAVARAEEAERGD